MEIKPDKMNRYVYIAYLLIWITAVLAMTIICRAPNNSATIETIPLWSYFELLKGNDRFILGNIINIIMFVPLGLLIPRLSKQKFSLLMIITLCFSLIIEIVQYKTCLGWFDVDDILNNSIGATVGYCYTKYKL